MWQTVNVSAKPGFGRLIAIDHRDARYMLKRRTETTGVPRYRYWFLPPVMDQDQTSECVGYGHEAYLAAGPVLNPFWNTPHELYKACQQVDEWPGDDYEGTSVRAAMKVFQKVGLVKEYRWATDADDVLLHLRTVGPVTMGTDWYNSMFSPIKDPVTGFYWVKAKPNSGLAGGHCYLLGGGSTTLRSPFANQPGAVQIQNSWGTGWGDNGRAFMAKEDLDLLIHNWGEAAASYELKGKDVNLEFE